MSIGTRNAQATYQAAENMFSAVGNAFKPSTWKNAAQAAQNAAGAAAHNPNMISRGFSAMGSGIGAVVSAPFKGAFAVGRWMVEAPFAALVLKPTKAVFNGVAGFYTKSPRVASVLTAGAAVVGIGSWLTKRQSQAAQDQYMAMASMAPEMTNPYMNSVTPQESAMLNARLKENSQGAGFGENVMASRAAAQPAAAETSAAL